MSEGNIENPEGLNEIIRDRSVTHHKFADVTEKSSPSNSAHNELLGYGLGALADTVQKIERRVRRIVHPIKENK